MGIPERQAREQAAMRASILDATLAIATAGGWDGVTMRRIAARIEFSPAALYAYFPAKADLLLVLTRLGFAGLGDQLRRLSESQPERRLRATAALIWDFAFEQQALYTLMQSTNAAGATPAPPEAAAVAQHVRAAMAGAFGAARPDLDDLVDLFWGAINGLIAQTRLERVSGGRTRGRRLLDRLTGDLIAAWRSR